jgi:hypothetical protein
LRAACFPFRGIVFNCNKWRSIVSGGMNPPSNRWFKSAECELR